MRLTTRIGITLVSSSLLLSGCSDHHDLSLNPPAQQNRRPQLLDPRTNPLQTYIETNWSGNGGSRYENIKLYGHSYPELGSTDADFVANHCDMYMGGGANVLIESDADNPSMLCLGEAANIPHIRNGWDLDMANDFLTNANPNNYKLDDMLLHYQVNTTVGTNTTPGWNPADDDDHDGCIEAGEGLNHNGLPSDSNRSAQCLADSRVRNGGPSGWHVSNPSSQAYIDFRAWMTQWHWDTLHVEGFHFDEASYQDDAIERDRTIEYSGLSETSSPYYYIEDKYQFVPAVMSEAEDLINQGPLVAIANVVNGDYLCGTTSYLDPQHEFAQDNLENILLETWMFNLSSADTDKRDRLLDCPFTDFLEQGKGVVFTYREDNAQGRLFSLCMFYMINHPMAFYYYTKQGHSGVNAASAQWNTWVAYNVGQPMVNDLGLSDFQSNSNTDRFFVFESGANYQVLGREYYREDDGATILVLAKLMGPGQNAAANSTSIALGDTYRKVAANFTLGPNITSVLLSNNQGAILVRGAGEGSGGGCHCELGN